MSLKILCESEVTPETPVCVFCKQNTVNELKFGPLYSRGEIVTHYFCMLFSAALNQVGDDDEGILGFLPSDIYKEIRRSNRLKCYHCEEVGASIGCCKKSCKKAFHFPCGLKNNANYRFLGNFESFCEDHGKVQNITLKRKDWVCPVCMTPVVIRERPIQASCCKAAVFHQDCMQKVALNAGYFFKCPTCNDSKKFTQEMRSLGIYVPQQDASWEREPNAYQDLLYQYSKCDAEQCECSQGREYTTETGFWSLARCRICGASGVHKKCGSLRSIEDWACEMCLVVEKKADIEKQRIKTEQALKKKELALEMKNRQLNATKQESDGEDDFTMADVVISETCYRYFPYDRAELQRYSNRESLPDWRNLELTVNLCDWIKFIPVACPQASPPRQADLNGDGDSKNEIGVLTPQNVILADDDDGDDKVIEKEHSVASCDTSVIDMPIIEDQTKGMNLESEASSRDSSLTEHDSDSMLIAVDKDTDPSMAETRPSSSASITENIQPPVLEKMVEESPSKYVFGCEKRKLEMTPRRHNTPEKRSKFDESANADEIQPDGDVERISQSKPESVSTPENRPVLRARRASNVMTP